MFIVIAVPFIFIGSDDVGSLPGYIYLFFGALPSAIIILAIRYGCRYSGTIALFYDGILLAILIYLLIVLTDYLGLILMVPFIGFLIEGIILIAYRHYNRGNK